MEDKDKELWKIAEQRVAFKKHLTTYILVNSFLWLLWFITKGEYDNGFPWPIYASLGWGIGILSHYIKAYRSNNNDAVEREYEKLRRKN